MLKGGWVYPWPNPYQRLWEVKLPAIFNTIPRTQKAKGIQWLIEQNYPQRYVSERLKVTSNQKYFLIQKEEDIETDWNFIKIYHFGVSVWFARPCPINPAHGFVESRIVNSLEDLKKVWEETVAADLQGEVILMPYVSAICSGIYVAQSGVLTVGPGHDGATGGSKEAITLPIAPTDIDQPHLDRINVSPTQAVYFELVKNTDEKYVYVVQARAGEPQNAVDIEFFPPNITTVKVSEILEPNGDDLWWEKITKEKAGCAGVIAYKEGAPLTSHAAHHCKTNKLPFVTRTPKPNVGDTIYYIGIPDAKFNEREFRVGVAIAEQYADIKKGLGCAIVIIHNDLYLSKSPHYSRLLGFAASMIYRAGAIACLGEARHYSGKNKWSREAIYRHGESSELPYLNRQLVQKVPRFIHSSHWGSSLGSWPWFEAAVTAVKLWNRISEVNPEKVLGVATTLLNKAHNNGWLFNKFISQDLMDTAALDTGWAITAYLEDLWDILHSVAYKPASYKRRNHRVANKKTITWAEVNGGNVQFRIGKQDYMSFKWQDKAEELKAFFEEV